MAHRQLFQVVVATIILVVPFQFTHAGEITGTVTHVRDGDTIVVGKQPIRLNGVSAPERNEAGGREATAFMKRLVLGKKLTCVDNGERTYDRLVARCYLNGKDIGETIIASGLARDCPRYSGGRYSRFEIDASRTLPLPRYCVPKR